MNELITGYYNKQLKPINPDNNNFGAILLITKEFKNLQEFINKLDFNKLN